jgi:hypothetical protein
MVMATSLWDVEKEKEKCLPSEEICECIKEQNGHDIAPTNVHC